MSDDQAIRVAVAFARQASAAPAARMCGACVEILDVSGVGVTIMSGTNSGPVCASDDRMSRLEDLQFSLGEGPCRDAYNIGRPIIEPDLDRPVPGRWPHYTMAALQIGARGVFAFPLTIGTTRVGVLTLYQDTPGPLSSAQTADSLMVADVIARTMVLIQSDSRLTLLASELIDQHAHRAEVHQASGMTSMQLSVSTGEALLRMKAHAFATNQSVGAVAEQIVARTLRLGDDRAHDSSE